MFLLKKYLKNNENINKYIFPETVASLLKTKSNNDNLYGTKLFGLSIEELLERQKILSEKKEKENKENNNKENEKNDNNVVEPPIDIIIDKSIKDTTIENNNNTNSDNINTNINNDSNNINDNNVTEVQTEIWQNDITVENNSVTMEKLFQSEYNLDNIPKEIQQFVNYLKQEKVLIKEGIFRLGGSFNLKNEMKDKINQTGIIDFTGYNDDHAIATLFKQFLRELSGKIIPKELFNVFDKAKENCDEMGKALLSLPKQRYDTLLYILEFMFYIDKYKSYNKMDIGNLSIMFAPNIIECPETVDMQTTLIAPLHITNTIIQYFKKLRNQREEEELKFSYFDIKPSYDNEKISVKDITFKNYDYDIISLEDSDSTESEDSDGSDFIEDLDDFDEVDDIIKSDENINGHPPDKLKKNKYGKENNKIKKEISSQNDENSIKNYNKNSKSNKKNNNTSFDNDINSIDSSTINIKYCTDIISLEDTFSNGSSFNISNEISDGSYSIQINECSNIASLEDTSNIPDDESNPISYSGSTLTDEYDNDEEGLSSGDKNKDTKEKPYYNKSETSDFFTNLSNNVYRNRRNSNIPNNKLKAKHREYEVYIDIDCKDLVNSGNTKTQNDYISGKEVSKNFESINSEKDYQKFRKSLSGSYINREDNDKNYYLSLLSDYENLNDKNKHTKEFLSSKYNNNIKNSTKDTNINNDKKPIIDSLKYISGELISDNDISNIYDNNSIEMNNKSKYSLLETMKVKDIMDLSSEEITRNYSINDSKLFSRDKFLQETRLPKSSKYHLLDTAPYSLNFDDNKEDNKYSLEINFNDQGPNRKYKNEDKDENEEKMRSDKNEDTKEINRNRDEINSNSNGGEKPKSIQSQPQMNSGEKMSEEEQKIREIISSINHFNKNKNRRKFSKCQSVFSENSKFSSRGIGVGNSRLSKSYSHMTIDMKRDEFLKSMKEFNTRMKNVTRVNNMKTVKEQQKRLFIERLKDLAHYLKYLERYCKELKEFSKKEGENTEVIKEMELYTRKKFKLLRNYIKDELNKYKIYMDGNINVYHPFIDLQSWMKKTESSDALSNHKELNPENIYLYYGINNLSPGQRIIRNLDKRRLLEKRPIYVFAMKPREVIQTYKDIKRELSYVKDFYMNLKSDEILEPKILEEYKTIDKVILKEIFWYIKRLKKAIETAKNKKKTENIRKIDNPFERCMYNACKSEKRKLQEELIKYQENFYKNNGRPIKTKNDLKPIEAQYKRYKELKSYLKSFSL